MGGGVMKSATKVAGIGSVVHSGVLRGSTVPTGHSVRKAAVPVVATLTVQNIESTDLSVIEKPTLEATDDFVDWHLVDSENEELMMSTGDSMPRDFFDAAPSFLETQEATTELKDALDKYISLDHNLWPDFQARLGKPKISKGSSPSSSMSQAPKGCDG